MNGRSIPGSVHFWDSLPKRLSWKAYGSAVALCFIAVAWPSTTGAIERTNEMFLQYLGNQVTITEPERSEMLFSRFFEEVASSDNTVFDRFTGPASQLSWERSLADNGYDNIDRFNRRGATLFGTIAVDSLRTAAAAALPLDSWQESWERGLATFLTGTVGNPQEEHSELRSITYSAVRSTWERAADSSRVQWGLRPWRTNPYLYFLTRAGRLDGRPLLTLETRAGYALFGSPRIEGRLTLQLPRAFRLAAAGAINPARIASGDPDASHCGLTLEKVLGSGTNRKGVFFLGFRSGSNSAISNDHHENLFIAGLARSW